jgi:hypothetical protein
MPIECPRCLATNLHPNLPCSCGYNPAATMKRQLTAAIPGSSAPTNSEQSRDIALASFATGIGILWVVLAVSEGVRLKLDRASRPLSQLIQDSLVIGTTDLAGAFTAGALAWMTIYVLRSYEALHYHPDPKRATLVVIILASVLLFMGRLLSPGVFLQAILPALLVLGAMALSYYAGSRQWFGKW